MARDDKTRLDIRIDRSLKERIKDYAVRHGTTVTSLVIEHFRRLLERDGDDPDARPL